jgi:hypothetical protein
MPYDLKCHGCQTVGSVNRITAGLRCSCGSTDLDVMDQPPSFLEFMGVQASSGGTGWTGPRSDSLDGWNVYQGPMPGPNPMSNNEPDSPVCPTCHGSGEDIRDNRNNGICRECGGSGHMTPTTTPRPTQVAPHADSSHTTKVPFMGTRKLSARCPLCRTAYTQLTPDHEDHAWWKCAACGPLADLDKHPSINPFLPSARFARHRGFRATASASSTRTGRVLRMFTAVTGANPGLTQREALGLVRRTIAKYDGE